MLRTYAASLEEDFNSSSEEIVKENSFTNINYRLELRIFWLCFFLGYVVLFPFFFPYFSFYISILNYF